MAPEEVEERKLAAIMFTDMVGYSALAQRDESLALELLDEHRAFLRPAFLKYHGQEIKTIGDGFLIEFASAVAAVNCAVELQEALAQRNFGTPEGRQLQVRIGIHLGDVLHRGDDILGDGVNIAARIEPLADSGGITITRQVFDQVYNKIPEALVRIGKIELKNINRPVEIYRIALGPKTRKTVGGKRKTSTPARQSGSEQQRSIAVLPFVNISTDQENEFLSDGISEDLLSALSRIEGLRVAARTSCFAFKGRNEDIRKIGEALGVETVLEGSLRRVGAKLRITAQLVKIADGFSLWSDRFDREMQDVFAVQDDITRAIIGALKLRLAGRSDQPVIKLQTTNTEAYELYLKGRFFWNQRGIGLRKALHYFELALIEDPEYALAMSGLSDAYSLLSWYGYLSPAEATPRAIAAANRAVQLDPQLAEAHASLGFCQFCHGWDRAGAEFEYRRAIELNPRATHARYWLGWLCSCVGHHEEAVEHSRLAVGLEPFSAIDRTFLGWMNYHARQFDEAEQQLRQSIELDKNQRFVFGTWLLGKVYVATGKYDLALQELGKAVRNSRGSSWTRSMLAHALGASGELGKAQEILADLQDAGRSGYIRAFDVATVYLGLRDRDQALAWLEKGCNDHDIWALNLKVDPIYADLQTDARFVALRRMVGLE
ncbi:MAG TPA: adenylate/guanylate cyclase domain-containing protein [Methylocella sp.]|nr:adenylate/guanylate cyclase domain-containing protein [Methylocella sp.]